MKLVDKYRPQTFGELVGLENVKNYFKVFPPVSHCFVFYGNPGVGKTTVARIICNKLNAEIHEFNAADNTGVDFAREIISIIDKSTFSGDGRVFILDESQKLTNQAQNAFLKPLEDGLKRDYIIFCTTEQSKLLKTLKDRCTNINFKDQTKENLAELLNAILKDLSKDVDIEYINTIIQNSSGSARVAVKLLDEFIISGQILDSHEVENSDIFRLYQLLFDYKSSIHDCISYAQNLNLEPEGIRMVLLQFFNSTLVKRKNLSTLKAMRELCKYGILGDSDKKFKINILLADVKESLLRRG